MTSSESHDVELVVESVRYETSDVLVLELVDKRGIDLPSWSPGAHIDLILPSGIVRQYSLCGDVARSERYRIAVLREEAGRGGSKEIHAIAEAGLRIRSRGPRNHFHLVDAPKYLFFAGGIGITPILPMILHAESTGRPWRLVYGGRARKTMSFLSEIERCETGNVTLLPQDESGLPNFMALLAGIDKDAAIYGCGPDGMLHALEAAATELNCGSALHVERFTADSNLAFVASENEDNAFEVELRQSGLILLVPSDRTLGSVLQDANVPVPFSCQEGYCGSCETRVLEGVPDHRDAILNDDEKAAGEVMMVCCGRSFSPRLVLDL